MHSKRNLDCDLSCSFQLVLPEYLIHFFFCVMFCCAAEWLTLCLNLPLLAYHVWRSVSVVSSLEN